MGAKMNEVMNLSNDINVITAEIKSYQQIAGQSIFEIGRRLKYVKENDLVHGQWSKWCEEEIDMDRAQADKFIMIAKELPNECTYTHLGFRALYEIATISPEARAKPHTIHSTGKEKTVDEMTVKELREVKKALKEKDKLLHQETEKRKRAEQETFAARKSEQLTRKQLEEREEQEPQIIEREVVKEVPVESKEHISVINKLKDENAKLRDKNQAVKDEATFYKQKTEAMSKSVEDMELEESSMNFMANKNVHNLIAYMDGFLKDSVVTSLMRGSIANASDATKELLDSRIEAFQEYINDLRIAKTGRKIN
ncbi:DUF3102 domain-containing protein [Bacillus thuringiensis]|uniref:DUF3102 domain-containing protein n=1 Tax=Bacillus thuringiensis TaxID=1428 RepID=UPI0026E3F562|nr:DUF3102 domain-containing protein [Bacillus thuringiensis]MDO6631793.1 DUF3102 domain-containing protein [Bacillus thuringiensis]MDO6661376.1 DUF3102 domain-containing protein [Bacillus thuringiensis]MDO6701933.1 DUF3102 domain-containing protein [Bacillus thuringiensis]